MTVHHYKTAGGKDLIVDYIMGLGKNEIIDGLSVLKTLEDNELDKLNISPWRGKVLEVYFYKNNRLFYVTIEDADIYILHACRKQKNKTEPKDSDIITKRAKELGDILSKKFI